MYLPELRKESIRINSSLHQIDCYDRMFTEIILIIIILLIMEMAAILKY